MTLQSTGKSPVSPLSDFIQKVYPLSREAINFIAKNSYTKKVAKGKFLLKAGEVCNHYYYIHKGLVRAYIKYGNKEITTWINAENEISTSIRGMVKQEPSLEYLQAIENCELIVLESEAVSQMYRSFPEMNTFGRLLLERYYVDAEERAFICRIPSADTRYRHFIESRSDLVNRLPLKYVASYLGITVETLSRLRGKKNI